jgi:hypothetical protein
MMGSLAFAPAWLQASGSTGGYGAYAPRTDVGARVSVRIREPSMPRRATWDASAFEPRNGGTVQAARFLCSSRAAIYHPSARLQHQHG